MAWLPVLALAYLAGVVWAARQAWRGNMLGWTAPFAVLAVPLAAMTADALRPETDPRFQPQAALARKVTFYLAWPLFFLPLAVTSAAFVAGKRRRAVKGSDA